MTDLKKSPKSLLDHARRIAKEAEAAEDIDAAFPPADGVDYESRHQRVGTILALAVLRHLFAPADLALLRGHAGVALVVRVPDRDWVKPVSRALQQFSTWADVKAHDGTSKSGHRADAGQAEVADILSAGHCLAGVSQDPERYLPANLVANADIDLAFASVPDKVLRTVVAQVTGRRVRRLPDGATDLPLSVLLACIRRGSTTDEVMRRLERAALTATAPDAGLDDVPHVADLAGYGEAKAWALRLVDEVQAFREGRIQWNEVSSRGVILASPPGLGKTSFARSVAKSLQAPLIPTSVAGWFGQGGSGYLGDIIVRAENVWREAAAAARGGIAVVLLDELDGLPSREHLDPRHRDYWAPLIHSVLLALSSAVSGQTARLVVIGCTNHAEHCDPALSRPGRLDRIIHLQPPTTDDLAAIVRQHLGTDLEGADLRPLAMATTGATGAEAAAWVRAARADALLARRPVEMADLVSKALPAETRSPEHLRAVALHEVAHAVAGERLGVSRVEHVSIIAHGSFAGRTRAQINRTEPMSRAEIEAFVVTVLCGRAADEVYGVPTAGASGGPSSDMGIATTMIASLHYSWSLGDRLAFRGSQNQALDHLRHSERFGVLVDDHLSELYARALAFVRANGDLVETLADRLVQARILGGDEVRRVIAEGRPGNIHSSDGTRTCPT
ncbi:hypothetical protein ASF49_01615 [Methylobacterium sp. Leaf104]|uniref:AAA family ATPase n=1 Tax=Methylobacterium TaxID=407 RepID=UPI0006FD1705|nr:MULTISPECIES: AAA family ATPase [Methylobacterium]KQP42571.1 hypothetical protein ASF49_01615 [Methylobacterium sp. Leaf104]MCI9878880.1 AAA family ATPase [Methylobacterium goesingense]